jgi:hypothetical protein
MAYPVSSLSPRLPEPSLPYASTLFAPLTHPPPPVPDTQVGEGKPGFFAISSAPDPNNQGLLEFLIKAQGEAAEAVAALQAGETESRGTMSITP